MNLLDAPIRAKLDAETAQMKDYDDDLPGFDALCRSRNAIEAVLDLHQRHGGDNGCATIQAIAREVGVSVEAAR
jgi:hypothetical protein